MKVEEKPQEAPTTSVCVRGDSLKGRKKIRSFSRTLFRLSHVAFFLFFFL